MQKKVLFIIIIIFITSIFNFCSKSPMEVLFIEIPNSNLKLSLWEKEIWNFWFDPEFETWAIIKNNKIETKYLIDDQYITFNTLSIYYSKKFNEIRIETSRKGMNDIMIAKYKINENLFFARNEDSIKNNKYWTLIKRKKIR